MNLLAELYNNQQNITQNPTGTIRTPRQIAYDNWLNAQQQAQNTTKDEWGQAIGNSVNGLAKIISSAVVKNPYERAGATRNLDNFDDRQDQLVRDWAMQRMKNRNDFVQQAKEQLGMAMADEEREYNRNAQQQAQQQAYEQWLQEQANKERELDIKQQIADTQRIIANNKPESKPEITPEQKLAWEIKAEEAKANAKAKREAQQDLNKALAGQAAFQSNIEHIKDLSKNSGNVAQRALGGVASLFTGKDADITKPNNAMGELVSQLRQAALVASGISGESDDKAQQAKLRDIYERAGVPMNAKSLTQAQVSSIINNIENIYKQRVAEKQSLLDSFNNNSVSWE